MLMPVFVWFQLKLWCWNIYIELCVCSPHCGSILAEKTVTCFSDVNLEVGHLVLSPQFTLKICCFCWQMRQPCGQIVQWDCKRVHNNPIELFCFGVFVGSSTEISKKGHIWLLFLLLLLTFYTVSFAKTISMGLVLLKERDTPSLVFLPQGPK